MLSRIVITALMIFSLAACGSKSGSTPPTFSQIAPATELLVYGVPATGTTISSNALYVTVDRSKQSFRKYSSLEYSLNTQLESWHRIDSFNGSDKAFFTVKLPSAGPHRLFVRGVFTENRTPHTEAGLAMDFTAAFSQADAGVGSYVGDSTLYGYNPLFSGMQVNFASYNGTANTVAGNRKVTADLQFTDLNGITTPQLAAGQALTINPTALNAEMFLLDTAGLQYASGAAFNHFLQLSLSNGNLGDMKLYRQDASNHVLGAYFNNLSPASAATLFLHSADKINFSGHMRLWNAGTGYVWTYIVHGYSNGAKSLSGTNDQLNLWFTKAQNPYLDYFLLFGSTDTNPFGAPDAANSPGTMTVDVDANGNFFVTGLMCTINNTYTAFDPTTITTKATFKQ